MIPLCDNGLFESVNKFFYYDIESIFWEQGNPSLYIGYKYSYFYRMKSEFRNTEIKKDFEIRLYYYK